MNHPRSIPAVERVLQALGDIQGLPRVVITAVVRRRLAQLRSEIEKPGFEEVLEDCRHAVRALAGGRIRPVINGTGVVIHTNLGRAPLPQVAVQRLTEVGSAFANVEYDLGSGKRGQRGAYLEHNLALLCGAESATVVNNCAAALVLILRMLTRRTRQEVVISRGELIQIGGGFRIPEILEESGAKLCEVGTTNQTTLADYERAVSNQTALILRVHRSNFFMEGFVAAPSRCELVGLARKRRLPLVEDLGSGAVIDTAQWGHVDREPTPAQVLRDGVSLVCFSGDKLFGGPQSGIIAGQSKRVVALKREPLFRAFRCDKLALAALEATADLHLHRANASWDRSQPAGFLPANDLPTLSLNCLRHRAEQIVNARDWRSFTVRISEGRSRMGGGTLPQSVLESVTIDLTCHSIGAAALADRLRCCETPLVVSVGRGRCRIDLRTVFPEQDVLLIDCLAEADERIEPEADSLPVPPHSDSGMG